jgi:NADPH:quinone reductase-like Zn-dependent oxidoreductase
LFGIAHQALPPFPRKTLGKPTEEQWKERCRALDLYFTGVLAMPALAQNSSFVRLFQRKEDSRDDGMNAAIYNHYGPPDQVIKVVDNLPKPAMPLKPHDVFIEVYASSVNPTDCRLMEGASDVLEFIGIVSFPCTPGVDVCGIVRGVGAEVTSVNVGDAVIADTGIVMGGAIADYCTTPEANCTKKPKNMSFIEAAAFPRSGLVAYQTLVHDLHVDSDGDNKRVLILGGHTGSGSIAIQIAKYFGCTVSCTVEGEGAEEWGRRLGADEVVLASSVEWWNHFKGFDAVFDTLGEEDGFERAKEVLSENGSFATELPEYLRSNSGALSDWVKQGVVTAGRKIQSLVPAIPQYHNAWAKVSNKDLESLRFLIEGGDFKTVANHYFPLKEAAKAFQLVKEGSCVGKVVIQVKQDIEQETSNNISLSSPPPAMNPNNNNNNNNTTTTADNNSYNAASPAVEAAPAVIKEPTRDLAADEYEEEPEGLANPFG